MPFSTSRTSPGAISVPRPDGEAYLPVEGSCENHTKAFFAYSSGMDRGYELIGGQGCELTYRIDATENRWRAALTTPAAELEPDQSVEARYLLRVLREVPGHAAAAESGTNSDCESLRFSRLENLPWKQAPVDPARRVTLAQVIAGMARGKTRGLNLRTNPADADDDLHVMKEWGANLVIFPLGRAEQLRQQVVCARRLGMEVFVQGRGAYNKEPPTFGPLWEASPSPKEMPDSFGQDEDHYYWHQPLPGRDFQAEFGHPTAQATQEEKVLPLECLYARQMGLRAGRCARTRAERGDLVLHACAEYCARGPTRLLRCLLSNPGRVG